MVLMPFSLSASMTRRNPSVNSCSVPGASDLVAVFSMGLVSLVSRCRFRLLGAMPRPSGERCRLEEFLTMRFDVSGKAKGVIAGALLGELGIARLQGFDHAEMLGERRRGAVLASDGQLPIATHVQQQVVGEIDQHR